MSNKWKGRSSGGRGSKPLDVDNSSKAFQLNKNRFVSVSEFRGQVRVDIREFYFDDSGDRKPTKKGISLSMDEWNKFKTLLPKIENAIQGGDDSDDSESDRKHKKPKKNKSESDSDSDQESKQKATKVKSKEVISDSGDSDSDRPPKKAKKSKDLSSDSDSD